MLVDDHSRLLVHGRWAGNETLRAGQEVLHAAILRRGLPAELDVDNGAAYAGAELARSCAILGVRLIHSRPYAPEGRGKQERLNRVIRERFPLEAETVGIASLEELNDRFAALGRAVPQRPGARDRRVAPRPVQQARAEARQPGVKPRRQNCSARVRSAIRTPWRERMISLMWAALRAGTSSRRRIASSRRAGLTRALPWSFRGRSRRPARPSARYRRIQRPRVLRLTCRG
jgi:Integrase core domain